MSALPAKVYLHSRKGSLSAAIGIMFELNSKESLMFPFSKQKLLKSPFGKGGLTEPLVATFYGTVSKEPTPHSFEKG